MENKLELVHFQITRNCNLRCSFCGQWGRRGVFADSHGQELTLNEWKALAKQLKQITPLPDIILWGGEPLVCRYFDELAEYLYNEGFNLGLVTNATLLDRHIKTVKDCFKRVYLSIDGEKNLHDKIRGEGVFDKVCENMKQLNKDRIMVMTVLTEELNVKSFAEKFRDYTILLHEMIPFEDQKVITYQGEIPENIILKHHGERAENKTCLSPNKHIHINWNGNVTFCTDFYDYSIGNVRNQTLQEIWTGEEADDFRTKIANDGYKNCGHCSWRNNRCFYLD